MVCIIIYAELLQQSALKIVFQQIAQIIQRQVITGNDTAVYFIHQYSSQIDIRIPEIAKQNPIACLLRREHIRMLFSQPLLVNSICLKIIDCRECDHRLPASFIPVSLRHARTVTGFRQNDKFIIMYKHRIIKYRLACIQNLLKGMPLAERGLKPDIPLTHPVEHILHHAEYLQRIICIQHDNCRSIFR